MYYYKFYLSNGTELKSNTNQNKMNPGPDKWLYCFSVFF